MDQLNAAMASIKQASTQSTSSTRQTEESVRDLGEMAHHMEQAVARYRLDENAAEPQDDGFVSNGFKGEQRAEIVRLI